MNDIFVLPITGKYSYVVCLVDVELKEDLLKYKWYYCKHNGYVYRTTYKGRIKSMTLHTHILKAPCIDHKNRYKLDNRTSNLRASSTMQNMRNTSKRRGASSKYRGVHWFKPQSSWIARIKIKGREMFLGYFDIEEDAARAYDVKARKHFGEFANPNFK